MFQRMLGDIRGKGETIQVQVESSKLVPNVRTINGKRLLFLNFDGTDYPCLERGWTSWADKILTPENEGRAKWGLVNEETGRKKRWSIGTVRKFLDMTPTDIADTVVKSWWKRHDPTTWHIIKYADNGNGNPGAIRYIGTTHYRLYKHAEFLADLSTTDFSGLDLRTQSLTEDHMVLRLTTDKPLPLPGTTNVFAGFHMLNSENGSSSIQVRHIIYDEICTNGLINLFDKKNLIQQRHSRFDVAEFREKVSESAKTFDDVHKNSVELISYLLSKVLPKDQRDAVLDMYEDKYEASKKFVNAVDTRIGGRDKAWDLISAITETAQVYDWRTRIRHEEQAGLLVGDIRSDRHMPYVKKEEECQTESTKQPSSAI